MPELHTRMALPPTADDARRQPPLPLMSLTALVMLAGGLGLLAGVLARSWRGRGLARRGRLRRASGLRRVRHVSSTRQDASLIGAERFPRKGDDDVTG